MKVQGPLTSKYQNNTSYALFYLHMKSIKTSEIDRIIEMAWEDRTPFEAILFQFKTPESEVIKIMRAHLKPSSFKLWRKRVNSSISKKHLNKRPKEINRFKCSRQKTISNNKISKR